MIKRDSKGRFVKVTWSKKDRQEISKRFKGRVSPMKGRHHSEESKRKISKANKGRTPYVMTEEIKEKIRKVNLGKKISEETKLKIGLANKGKKNFFYGKSEYSKGPANWRWCGGVSTENQKIRSSKRYVKWRTKVFQRDSYTCQWCGQVGGKLNADHIKPFSKYPKLRFKLDNGRTLCYACHKKTDTYGNKNKDNI